MAKGSKNYVEFHEEKKNLQKFRINLFSKKMQMFAKQKCKIFQKEKFRRNDFLISLEAL